MEHTDAMRADLHAQRILHLARQKGWLRAHDIEAIEAPRVVLTRLTAAGLLTRVGRGLYGLPDHQGSEHEGLAAVATQAPRIEYPPLRMVQMTGEAYTEGIESHERDGAVLRDYSAAKTVADCFKHRHRIGLDVALEALRDARRRRKATADELWRFAGICRVANVMRPYLEAVG
jgi:predicted transcriptional regulator of viral defense system